LNKQREQIQVEEQPEVEDIAWALLESCGINQPPTDPEDLARFLGLEVRSFDPLELAQDLGKDLDVIRDIRALLVPHKKQIQVNNTLDSKRRRFSILHEIAHYVLPGHASESDLRRHSLPIGSASTSELTTDALITKEQEANQFAAACLFQVERFNQMIETMQFGWDTIQELARIFDTSFEATARRYVEQQKARLCALVIFKPTDLYNPHNTFYQPPLALEYTITSPGFGEKYFKSLRRDQLIDMSSPAHNFFYAPYVDNTLDSSFSVMIAGEGMNFDASFFSNKYKLMALLTPVKKTAPSATKE
jgi:hypothetical protein